MSKARLKKVLSSMPKEEIIEVLTELYDARRDARDYLDYWLSPDSDKELEKRRLMLRRLFFTSTSRPRKLPTLTDIKRVIKDFTTICFDSDKVADLLLYLCDCYADWMTAKRFGATAATAAGKALDNATSFIGAAGLGSRFSLRLDNLRERIDSLIRSNGEAHSRRRFGRWHW